MGGVRDFKTDSIASAASTSGGFDIGGRAYSYMGVQVGTMSTAAAITLQNSVDGGTTWYNVFHPPINSSSVATNQMTIASGVGTNGGFVMVPAFGLTKVRLLATGTVNNGVGFKIVLSD